MAEAARRHFDPYFHFRAPVSTDEYLSEELGATVKSEFIDGHVYAMAGTSDWHNVIALNLAGFLNAQLPDPCRALALDVKLQIKTQITERYYYPDVFVSCGSPLAGAFVHTDAMLVAEVLSQTTARFDRGEKMTAYRQLPSLEEYVLIWPDEAIVEIYRKNNAWQCELIERRQVLRMNSVSLELPLVSRYRRVPVQSEQPPA